jgi:ubiquitin-activating enzyme E1
MVQIAKTIDADSTNEDTVKTLSFTCQGSIVGLTAFGGGVVAQECLKSLSGKYTPLQQWVKNFLGKF